MSATEEPPAMPTTTATEESAAKPIHDDDLGNSPDSTHTGADAPVASELSEDATSAAADAHVPVTATTATTTPADPFDTESVEPTPALPPRPEEMAAIAPATVPQATTPATPQEAHVNPQVEGLRAMFPDFDVAVLQSVLDSVNNDQERALDVLLGMSDPEYVSTQTATQHEPPSVDLDEQLARQLMLEDQQQHQQRRHATGSSWPQRSSREQVPYQTRQYAPDPSRLPPPEDGVGKSDFQELQRTMGQIAESGKRTFSSIVSKVKAKINEYEQTRATGQPAGSSTSPQWGSSTPPTQLDRHSAQQAYQQQYFSPEQTAYPSSNVQYSNQISVQHPEPVQGYNLDAPVPQSQLAPQTPPSSSPVLTPVARSTSPQGSGLSPAASPRPSSDVPRPPQTISGSPVNAAKIGLLPKRPVSLLNTSSPPPTRPTDDEELEYVENPFEEHK